MFSLQRELLTWAATQSAATGLVLLAAGVVYAFFGFRVFRLVLAVSCGALGWFAGAVAARVAGMPPEIPGWTAAAALAVLSIKWERPAVAVASSATWALFGLYLATQIGLPKVFVLSLGAITGVLGLVFALVCYRTMSLILTTMQGTVLMLVGWVALSSRTMPAIGHTFCDWANNQSLIVPIFLVMLFAAAYSYQAMHAQGDIKTGR